VLARLRQHPNVTEASPGGDHALTFGTRHVDVGTLEDLRGLVEIVDNNPMVCADSFAVPSPLSTLIAIAVDPIREAGLLIEEPVVQTNLNGPDPEPFLGYSVTVSTDTLDFGSVGVATVIAAIRTPDRLEDLDDLYEERFGRSFYVRRAEGADWDTKLVAGQAFAAYRLRIAPDEPFSLLTIQVMSDLNGKLGSAQVVHAFNVMNGFEETLGIH